MKMIFDSAVAVADAVAGNQSNNGFRDVAGLSGGNRMMALVVLVVYLVLLLLVGKWLWNNVLCKVVTIVKPMPDVLTLLGLVLVLELVLPC